MDKPFDKQALIASINHFFDVIHADAEKVEKDERIHALIHALDWLAVHSHQIEFTFDETDYLEPPAQDYEEIYAMIGKQLPDLGYYNVATQEKLGESQVLIGDAIGDLSDIYCELKDVMWYFDNTSDANALLYFEQGYRTHWEKHLRELQGYLCQWKRNYG